MIIGINLETVARILLAQSVWPITRQKISSLRVVGSGHALFDYIVYICHLEYSYYFFLLHNKLDSLLSHLESIKQWKKYI